MKKILLLTLGLCVFACGGDGDSDSNAVNECGLIGLNNKVINGEACGNLSVSPVVRVSAVINLLNTPVAVPVCTGSMLSATDVLTAAHCFFPSELSDFPIQSYGIIVGDADNPVFYEATNILQDPGLTFVADNRLFNDTAIMKLSRSPGLPTLVLYTSAAPVTGQTGAVYGYGLTDTDPDAEANFEDLESGSMTIREVTENHIFVRFDGSGVNVCNGDSGGPMIIETTNGPGMVGVVSQGSVANCESGDVTTFTNLQKSQTLNWIRNNVSGLREN